MVVMIEEVDTGHPQFPPQSHQLLGIGRETVGLPDTRVRAQDVKSHGLSGLPEDRRQDGLHIFPIIPDLHVENAGKKGVIKSPRPKRPGGQNPGLKMGFRIKFLGLRDDVRETNRPPYNRLLFYSFSNNPKRPPIRSPRPEFSRRPISQCPPWLQNEPAGCGPYSTPPFFPGTGGRPTGHGNSARGRKDFSGRNQENLLIENEGIGKSIFFMRRSILTAFSF